MSCEFCSKGSAEVINHNYTTKYQHPRLRAGWGLMTNSK